MRIERLFEMGFVGLASRSRQEATKWLERVGMVGRQNGRLRTVFIKMLQTPALDAINPLLRKGDLDEVGNMLLYRFRKTGPTRFFEGVTSEQMPSLFADRLPGAREQAIAAADAICGKRFDLLGYQGLYFGDPVDWHLDPISGRRAPLVHWSEINIIDPVSGGDPKVISELNRHQWLIRLGQAYWLTEDERYAETFIEYIREWMQANPPGVGINWASSLEVALRLISWCWALFLFRRSKALSPRFFLTMLEGIWMHATRVERYLSYYFAPNTHLTGEALGLFYAGIAFPELRQAARWRKLGAQILVEQIKRQVLPDGVYFEQTTCYQRYTVETYLQFLILASRNGLTVPTDVEERVQRMLDFLVAIRRIDGSIPQIGDADGGWLLPLATRAADDFRAVFATAAALLGRSDCAWAAGGLAPEIAWLLGAAGMKAFEALRPAPPATAASRLFADGGYAVMQSGWEGCAHQVIFDVGPLASPVSGAHGHADLLSIQCSFFGEPYLVDPGTYCYTANPHWRNFFRGTAAHNTVMVDREEQAFPAGPFGWKALPRPRLRRWLSTEAYDFADAAHDAYRRLPDPVVHRRRVLFMKSRSWVVVVDDLEGKAEHRVELRFQIAPVPVTVDTLPWIKACGHGGRVLLLRAFAGVELKAQVLEGELDPIQGWVSHDYGLREPAPVLIYSAVAPFPIRIVTVLVPAENEKSCPPMISPLMGEGLGPMGLVLGEGQEVILIGARDIVLERK